MRKNIEFRYYAKIQQLLCPKFKTISTTATQRVKQIKHLCHEKKFKKVAKYFASLENCSTFALAFRAMAR